MTFHEVMRLTRAGRAAVAALEAVPDTIEGVTPADLDLLRNEASELHETWEFVNGALWKCYTTTGKRLERAALPEHKVSWAAGGEGELPSAYAQRRNVPDAFADYQTCELRTFDTLDAAKAAARRMADRYCVPVTVPDDGEGYVRGAGGYSSFPDLARADDEIPF